MREIKFRAWDKEKNKMMFQDNPFYSQIIASKITMAECGYDIDLMQFTGLHDKAGKEIYEGDIVKANSSYGIRTGIIKWIVTGAGACLAFTINDGTAAWDQKDCEVIGNIYENPELLETK